MIPSTRTNTRGIAESALDLVRHDRGGDPVLARRADMLADGHDRRPVVAGVGRFERKVCVIAIEITDVHTIGERTPIYRRPSPAEQAPPPGLPPAWFSRPGLAIVGASSSQRAPVAAPKGVDHGAAASLIDSFGQASSNFVDRANAAR